MTGNDHSEESFVPEDSEKFRLQAVTICINYADYLECIVQNARHFDRWIVLTVADDEATHEVCVSHGIECRESTLLRGDGADFNAAINKGPILNEGLDLLGLRGWALLLDADVLLPRHFRQRLECLSLEPGCLYGVAGRKGCPDRESFEALRHCEPWDRLVLRNSQPIGYFNLFHLSATPNRYPKRTAAVGGIHDDYLFTTSFSEDHRRQVPMTAIHTGPISRNWSKRVSEAFTSPSEGVASCDFPNEFARLLTEVAPKSAAVAGYFPGGHWNDLTKEISMVYLIDQFHVHAPSGSAMLEADRTVLRRIFAQETAGMSALQLLGPHSAESLARIPDGTVDLLYLAGEVRSICLSAALPHWRAKLSKGAIICGDLFGHPYWKEATYAISLLIGTPDGTLPQGFWWKRVWSPEHGVYEKPRTPVGDEDGVVFVNMGRSRIEPLLVSLHSMRRHWAGAITVLHWGAENEGLRIICSRLRVDLRHIGVEENYANGDLEQLLDEACFISPYRRGLLLLPGMLAVAALAPVFEQAVKGAGVFRGDPRKVAMRAATIENPVVEPIRFSLAQTYFGRSGEGPIVIYAGEPQEWTDPAWEYWSQCEADASLENAAEVRVAAEATIVSIVTEDIAGEFQRNWLSWRFPTHVPVILFLAGMEPEEIWLPGIGESVRLMHVPPKEIDNLQLLLQRTADCVTTAKLIFLPATAAALPGAELWPGREWEKESVSHESIPDTDAAEVKESPPLLDEFFGMVPAETLLQACNMREASGLSFRELPILMGLVDDRRGRTGMRMDMTRVGWKLPFASTA